MKAGLPKILQEMQLGGGGLTDGQLLGRFVATRDETSFAALVRRHGSMVLGVCRRVLRDFHAAEDAFQATFLILARKAGTVVKRESVSSFLYGVAYRTAREAARYQALRGARERPMKDMPQPETAPADVVDWRPLLDRELDRLSERYREAVVLCDLEGRTRKEAARVLGVPESTVCSRLARARVLLAKRLAARGVALSATALAALVAADAVSAQVPAALVRSTARVAALVAAGRLAAASKPAVLLMKGVMQAMLMQKLKLAVGAVMVAAALGAVGFACRPVGEAHAQQSGGSAAKVDGGKPLSELERLRRDNELLKYNLQVVLEKSAAQEKELQALRGKPPGGSRAIPSSSKEEEVRTVMEQLHVRVATLVAQQEEMKKFRPSSESGSVSTALAQFEAALKELRKAFDKEESERKRTGDTEKKPRETAPGEGTNSPGDGLIKPRSASTPGTTPR